MKSARRASEIHEQRTGRPLRITKDVVRKEEMYEEIIPLPVRYRNLITWPKFEHADFDESFLPFFSGHLETRNRLDQTAAVCWQESRPDDGAPPLFPIISDQATPPQQDNRHRHNVQDLDMSLRTTARELNNYRHAPYPLATPNKKPERNSHAVSPALQTPEVHQQHLNYSYNSPLQSISCDERRMSLSASRSRSSLSDFGGTSRKSSRDSFGTSSSLKSSMPPPDRRYHHHGQPRRSRFVSSLIDYPAASSASSVLTEPLSTEHPLDCEQLLAKDPSDITLSLPFPWPQSAQSSLRGCNYLYHPNARSNEREIKKHVDTTEGLGSQDPSTTVYKTRMIGECIT